VKIYTRKGDSGRTKLFGGVEVDKHDARVAAYGTLDELNASLGLVVALERDPDPVLAPLERVQEDLFVIGSRLAAARPERELERGTIPALEPDRIVALEEWIDRLDEELPPLTAFVLPGGSSAGAQLHVARTICRRAEREITALVEVDPDLAEAVVPYVNRLSDLLFTLARAVNQRAGKPETSWLPQRASTESPASTTDRDRHDRE
jgi:cob(I)alamin adenosyltransferase